ncbi:hypothetical protein QQ045_016466 [Rhodiola kirilowii]
MTKPGESRSPAVRPDPRSSLNRTSTASSKLTRRVSHPPMPLYSPSRPHQHTPQHISLRFQGENVSDITGRNSTRHNVMDREHVLGNSSQADKDVYKQSSKERDVDSKNKKNLTWTTDMDDYLLDCLLDQMQKGQKIGENFTKAANLAVAHLVREKFCIACNSDNIKYRMKTLKKHYFGAKEILSGQYRSGFGFNHSTYMIEASALTWDSYIKAHPSASTYRYKQVQHWEKMDIIYGKDRVTEEHEVEPIQSVRLLDNEEINIRDSSEQGADEENAIDPEIEPTSSTSKLKIHEEPTKKRKRIVELFVEELHSLKEGMTKVAEAINPRNYTEKEIFEHTQKINGMSARNKMKVYQSITEDVNLARSFIGCAEEMHALWISTKFGESIFDL